MTIAQHIILWGIPILVFTCGIAVGSNSYHPAIRVVDKLDRLISQCEAQKLPGERCIITAVREVD